MSAMTPEEKHRFHRHKWAYLRGESEIVNHIDYGDGRYTEREEFYRLDECTVCGKTRRRYQSSTYRSRT